MKRYLLPLFFLLLFITGCSSSEPATPIAVDTPKTMDSDPFKKSMTPSQTFLLDAKKDHVVVAKGGTRLVTPVGCFLNEDGSPFTGEVKIELTEALRFADMVRSNLTTTSNGEPLETGGMLHFSATGEGKSLRINPALPVYAEIPTAHYKKGMQVYQGTRDKEGNMDWANPRPLENFLVPVDLTLLNFKPKGFEQLLNEGMPLNGHKMAYGTLADSFYYALEMYMGTAFFLESSGNDTAIGDSRMAIDKCGIRPANVMTLKSPEMQNSFIATREFECRMRELHKSCDNYALELYTSNLDKNLYEVDRLVMQRLQQTPLEKTFEDFAAMRHTRVKDDEKYGKLLSAHYAAQLKANQQEIESLERSARAIREKKLEPLKARLSQLHARYDTLLQERAIYAYKVYGFTLTESGWINIDVGINPKNWGAQPIQLVVENMEGQDRTHGYLLFPSNGTLVKMTNGSEGRFGPTEAGTLIKMPKEKKGIGIAVAYKGDSMSLGFTEFPTFKQPVVKVTLKPSSQLELEEYLAQFENIVRENDIAEDLRQMAEMNKTILEMDAVNHDSNFMRQLAQKITRHCGNCPVAR